VPGRELDDELAMNKCQRASGQDEAAIRRACEFRDGAFDLRRVAHVDRDDFDSQRRRHRLDGSKLADAGRYSGIAKDGHAPRARRNLFNQFQPFPAQGVFKLQKSSGVAARPRQAVNEAGADRIASNREHDRHGAGRLQQRSHGRGAMGQDDVRRERGQFRRVSANVGH
jgi:hypothetical protein